MSTDEWMDKVDVVHIYSGIPFSHKKEWNVPFAATWMELEIAKLSGVSQKEKGKFCGVAVGFIWGRIIANWKLFQQKEKDKYRVLSLICGIQIWRQWTYLWNRNQLTDLESGLVVATGMVSWGGIQAEFGVNLCKLVYQHGKPGKHQVPLKLELCDNWEGWDVQEGGNVGIPTADSCWGLAWNWHNAVRPSSFN